MVIHPRSNDRGCLSSTCCNDLPSIKQDHHQYEFIYLKWLLLPDVLTKMMPQPSDQHQPTRQKRTVNAWKMPMVKLMMKASNLCSTVTWTENLGAPRQMPNIPLRIVPFFFKKKKRNNDPKWTHSWKTHLVGQIPTTSAATFFKRKKEAYYFHDCTITCSRKECIKYQTNPRQTLWKYWQSSSGQRSPLHKSQRYPSKSLTSYKKKIIRKSPVNEMTRAGISIYFPPAGNWYCSNHLTFFCITSICLGKPKSLIQPATLKYILAVML